MKHPQHQQLLGKTGEDLAVSYLLSHGYSLVERNFKARYGEIDIICTKDNTLVFVEVKTRIGNRFGTPEEAVTSKKLHEVIKTAEYYKLTHKNVPDALRIDVVAIDMNGNQQMTRLNHIESVTNS
jgi:putative endonuclease